MQPVVSVEEMRAIDGEAQASVGTEVLIGRAGRVAAREALRLLGGSYGRRAVLVAGRGNNGQDGKVAAQALSRRGVHVVEFSLAEAPRTLPACDLVLDAAVGTGFHGDYEAPAPPPGAAVLALDIPSGVDADTGVAGPGAVHAAATVTFAALKPGLLLGEGPEHAGVVTVADIGLDVGRARQHLIEDADLAWLPRRGRNAHKWQSATFILAGSPGMPGAAALSASGALRAGSGMVRIGSPGLAPGSIPVTEAVAEDLPPEDFAPVVLAALGRIRALVVGPGLGRAESTVDGIRRLVAEADVPLVLDADGLNAIQGVEDLGKLVAGRHAPIVLTPHDGEFARLTGRPPGADRLAATRALARGAGVTVLLKGSTTIVCTPAGEALFVAAGSPRLATGGTGDVLSGVIAAFLARGLAVERAAALAAYVHGRAAALGPAEGLVASDLPPLVARLLSEALPSSGEAQFGP